MGRFFLFLVYSFLYLCVGGTIIGIYLGVSPFACFSVSTKEVFFNPFADWYLLYMRFQYDNWAVNSLPNLIIFFTFLFYFPIWIGLWFLLLRIHWGKYFKPLQVFKRHKVVAPTNVFVPQSNYGRPVAMRKTSGFSSLRLSMQEEKTQQASSVQQASPAAEPASNTTTTASSGEAIGDALKEQIRTLGTSYGFDMFENVRLGEYLAPLVLATDTVALVLTVMTQDREWIADEEAAEEDMEPTWFSAEGLVTSPFYLMSKAALDLKEKEPDSEIVPVVVLAKGSILNVAAMMSKWQEAGGQVVSFAEGKGEGLLTLEALLQSKS